MTSREEQEQLGKILVKQADHLITMLAVDVSTVPKWQMYSPVFRLVADAYDQLAFAEKQADPVMGERTNVDGRNGAELMQRLWDVREEIRRQDSQP